MINLVQTGGREVTVLTRDINGKRKYEKKVIAPYFFVPDKNGEYKSLYGQKLRKVITRTSGDVAIRRENYPETYESDILFTNRVLIDCFDNIPIVPIRQHYFDMENKDCLDTLTTPEPITCISVYDTFLKKYNTFVWRKDQKERKEDWGKEKYKHNVWFFNNEIDLLEKWIKFIQATDPDIFQGWHILGFDWIYIINRCRMLSIDINKVSFRGKEITYKVRMPWSEVNIPGRYIFDTFRAYKESKFKELSSYSLNTVAKKELKDEKIKVESFESVWLTDLPKLIERCRKDVELVMKIDKKFDLFEGFNIMRLEIGCRWEDIWNTTLFHDITFLREAKLQRIKLPRKLHPKRESTKGGFVHEPIPGLHKNIIVLDLKSLYPFIIKTYNISPETLDENGESEIKTPFGTYRFSLKKKGICSTIVDKMLKKRVEYKNEMQQHPQDSPMWKTLWWKQEAMKRLANKVYGALANNHFRLYKIECARPITSIGQAINKFSAEKVSEVNKEIADKVELLLKEFKIKVVYGDTDSIFISCPPHWSKEECEKFGIELTKKINSLYQDFVNNHFKTVKDVKPPKSLFEIEYECIYTSIFFRVKGSKEAAKKRYCAVRWSRDKNNEWERKYEVKGFETVRCLSGNTEIIIKQNTLVKKINASDLEKYKLATLKILDDSGVFRKIRKIFVSKTNELLRFKLINGASLSTTKEHKFMVKSGNKVNLKKAKNITLNDKLPFSYSIVKCNEKIGDYKLGRFLGLFLAEGSFQDYGINFTFNYKEKEYINFIRDIINKRFGLYTYIKPCKKKNSTRIHVFDDGIKEYIKCFVCGEVCNTKHLSTNSFNSSLEFKNGIIDGVFEGDGTKETSVLTTTSRKLTKDILALCSLCGRPYTLYDNIKSKEKNRLKIYRIKLLKKTKKSNVYNKYYKFAKKNIVWLDIKSININKDAKRRKRIKVFDIEIDSKKHLFRIANGIITHNSDSAQVEQITFDHIYEEILNSATKEDIHDVIDETKRMLMEGKFKFDDFAIRRGITLGEKKDVYVRAADYGNAFLGCRFGSKAKIKMLYVNYVPGKLPLPPQKVDKSIAYENEEQLFGIASREEWFKAINWRKTFERLFNTKMNLIDKSMGWDSESQKGKQQTLF